MGALTCQDWLQIPEDLRQHEIIDGEHYSFGSPDVNHQRVLGNLLMALHDYSEERGACVLPRLAVVLSDIDVVIPDVIYLADANAPFIRDYVFGLPEVVIEIIDERYREHDEVVKLRLYERAPVGEYWIVDPDFFRVTIYRLDGGAYQCVARLEAHEALTSSTLPGLRVPLANVFERVV